MTLTRDNILDVLKTVTYPGFSRDIVSFGMVSNIDLSAEAVKVVLTVASSNEEQKAKLVAGVKSALASELGLSQVEVDIIPPQPRETGIASGSMGPGQAQSLIPDVKHTIAIASGKGGVGKSTVAVNLAAAMSVTGAHTGILDLDIYGPSLPMIIGTHERPVLNEQQKIVPLERHGMRVMSFGFISGNQAPTIWRGPLVAKMTQQFFEDVAWGDLDYLIIDLPPGTGDIQLTLVQQLALSGAVIVTTPQKLALLDVRKGADMFAKVHTPLLGVIENMSGLSIRGTVKDQQGQVMPGAKLELEGLGDISEIVSDEQGHFQVSAPIFRSGGGGEESERLQVPLLGQIPLTPELVTASDAGEPYVLRYPETPASREFGRIAKTLMTDTSA